MIEELLLWIDVLEVIQDLKNFNIPNDAKLATFDIEKLYDSSCLRKAADPFIYEGLHRMVVELEKGSNSQLIRPRSILNPSSIHPQSIIDPSSIHPRSIPDPSSIHPGSILDPSSIHPGAIDVLSQIHRCIGHHS